MEVERQGKKGKGQRSKGQTKSSATVEKVSLFKKIEWPSTLDDISG